MLPCPHSRPEHLAARSVLLGALLSAALLFLHGYGWQEFNALLQDTLVVDAHGSSPSDALAGRCLSTLLFVLAALALAFSAGICLALTAGRLHPGLLAATSLLGQCLAALPVAGLSWWTISGVVIVARLPVESLIPYIPPPERDHWQLALGRALWSWLLPLWVLALPLFGEALHAVSDRLRAEWPLPHEPGLRAAGQGRKAFLNHWLSLAWASLHDRWQALGLLALGYTVLVEDAFGLPGWGGFFASNLKTGNSAAIAAAVYACGWLAALWTIPCALLRWLTLHGAPVRRPVNLARERHPSALALVFMTASTVLMIGLVPPYAQDSWVRAFFQSWVYSSLPSDVAAQVQALLPGLRSDLQTALIATLLAVTVALIRGGMAWFSHQQDRMPKFQFLEAVCWSPLLVLAFALTASTGAHEPLWLALGFLGGTTGARQLRDLGILQRAALYVDAARVAGIRRWPRWRRHVLPPLLHWLAAWSLQMIGTTLLWSVLLRSLSIADATNTSSSLGLTLALSRNEVLTQPSAIYYPTLLTAITVLYFWRLARMVR